MKMQVSATSCFSETQCDRKIEQIEYTEECDANCQAVLHVRWVALAKRLRHTQNRYGFRSLTASKSICNRPGHLGQSIALHSLPRSVRNIAGCHSNRFESIIRLESPEGTTDCDSMLTPPRHHVFGLINLATFVIGIGQSPLRD